MSNLPLLLLFLLLLLLLLLLMPRFKQFIIYFGAAPGFQPLMSTPMLTALAKRRTAEGSESTPSAPEPAPPTAGPSDGNSVAALQDDQSEGDIFGDADSTQDSDWSPTASTPSTVSTSLVNTDKLSENSPRSSINLDEFVDDDTINTSSPNEAAVATAREKIEKMVAAQSAQVTRTNEGREEAALAARVHEILKQSRKNFDPYLLALSARLSAINATPVDPATRRAAMSGPYAAEWEKAELKEMHSVWDLGTWVLVIPPDGANIITCKWVYKVKYNADGTVERFKARIVARGFQQIEFIDYEETFAPAAKFVTIRLMCSLACSLQWPLEQCDIETAFLWASIDEDKPIYMAQPEGYVDPERPNHVCLLKKSIYGLKQSPYLWTQLLAKELKTYGYKQLITDMSCFVKSDKLGTCIIIACYVDDLLIMGRTPELIETAISELKEKFKVKTLGQVSWILGIAAERSLGNRTFVLHQRKYINDMVK